MVTQHNEPVNSLQIDIVDLSIYSRLVSLGLVMYLTS